MSCWKKKTKKKLKSKDRKSWRVVKWNSHLKNPLAYMRCILCEKNVNPFPNKPWFSHVCSRSTSLFKKTLWEKEKLLIKSNFSFSHSVFYPFWRTFCHFHQPQNFPLQTLSVWESLKFVFLERFNPSTQYFSPGQPAQTMQADLSQNFLLQVLSLLIKGPCYHIHPVESIKWKCMHDVPVKPYT